MEIEIAEGLDEGKVCEPGLGEHTPFRASGGLGFEQTVEEIEVGELVLPRLLGDRIDQLRHPLEFQSLEVRLDTLGRQAHSSAS